MEIVTEQNNRCNCSKCGSSFYTMFLIGKQGNADTCPMCGGELKTEELAEQTEEHPDWITWWYYGYKEDDGKTASLRDKPIDLNEHGDIFFLIKEFKAPPRDSSGSSDEAKRILRTYVPDAFNYPKKEEPEVRCPYCRSTEIQLVPKKFSVLTGILTNGYNRVCIHCKRKF